MLVFYCLRLRIFALLKGKYTFVYPSSKIIDTASKRVNLFSFNNLGYLFFFKFRQPSAFMKVLN